MLRQSDVAIITRSQCYGDWYAELSEGRSILNRNFRSGGHHGWLTTDPGRTMAAMGDKHSLNFLQVHYKQKLNWCAGAPWLPQALLRLRWGVASFSLLLVVGHYRV